MIKVAPVGDPANYIQVAETSWKHWPASKEVPGGKMRGKDHYVVVTDQQVERASATALEPKSPTVPPEVQRIHNANSTPAEDAPKGTPIEAKAKAAKK